MKDIFNVLRETPLIFRFSIKDSEKTYIWKIKRGLSRGASKQHIGTRVERIGVTFSKREVRITGFKKIDGVYIW